MNDTSSKETFRLVGDPERGGMGIHDLQAGCLAKNHPVWYRGKFGEFRVDIDVYPDLGEGLSCLLFCPSCQGGHRGDATLKISGKNKRIEFTGDKKLSVEKFTCTWELDQTGGNEGRRLQHGLGLCNASFVIDNNTMRDA